LRIILPRPCEARHAVQVSTTRRAIALNLPSVGAAYGVLVLIFKQGCLESVLGFRSIAA